MRHLLIVDDMEMIAYSLRRYFEHHGYRVTVAHDGTSALEAVRNESIDAVITDFRIPRMNGQQLLAELRRKFPDLPAVIVTAYGGQLQQEMDAITRVVNKPVALHELFACVNTLLGNASC